MQHNNGISISIEREKSTVNLVHPFHIGNGSDMQKVRLFTERWDLISTGDVIEMQGCPFFVKQIIVVDEPDWFEEYHILDVVIFSASGELFEFDPKKHIGVRKLYTTIHDQRKSERVPINIKP